MFPLRGLLRASALSLTLLGPALAEEAPVSGVVELFTSQGCKSCPPADAALAGMAGRPDLLALAFHVDYWDYLGWRDGMATPENTLRQKLYGKRFGARSIYTPQAIVNGRAQFNGAKAAEIAGALETQKRTGEAPSVVVKTRRVGDSLMIDVAEGALPEGNKAHLMLVGFGGTTAVKIDAGDNQGQTFSYVNAVKTMRPIGVWKGQAMHVELPWMSVEDNMGAAVILQVMGKDKVPGPILGAAIVTRPDRPRDPN
ncbi:MAG: DUF1223 domain-containing protein [Methylobacterium mesophilicum]|nr:DUF1223 domain-containing protein [Methylobacterium mesophilicum]